MAKVLKVPKSWENKFTQVQFPHTSTLTPTASLNSHGLPNPEENQGQTLSGHRDASWCHSKGLFLWSAHKVMCLGWAMSSLQTAAVWKAFLAAPLRQAVGGMFSSCCQHWGGCGCIWDQGLSAQLSIRVPPAQAFGLQCWTHHSTRLAFILEQKATVQSDW